MVTAQVVDQCGGAVRTERVGGDAYVHLSNAADFGLELVGEHIREAMEDLDFSAMSVQMCGSPTEAVLETMRELRGSASA